MELPSGPETKAPAINRIREPRLVLRPIRPAEIEEQWQAMVTADPMTVAGPPEEAAFKARLRRSGQLVDGWPPGRALPPGTFDVGISLRQDMRSRGYGREALMVLTSWLFENAAAQAVEAPTDSANVAMRTVFDRCGWTQAGSVTDHGRMWLLYRITRPQWEAVSHGSGVSVP